MKQEPLTESYYYILLCLYKAPLHGYGIMQMTKILSEGHVNIGSGTMYGATGNMIKKKWIQEISVEDDEGKNRRYYELTANGREVLKMEITRLHGLLKAAEKVTEIAETSY